jgi:tetratricopeptide (TPR) repeat protein
MPQPPRPLNPGRSDRDWFGAELRYWRGLRGLSQAALGALVHVSGDLIGKIEKAERACLPELAAALDAALRTGGVLARALVRVTAEADRRAADADTRAPGAGNAFGGPGADPMLGPSAPHPDPGEPDEPGCDAADVNAPGDAPLRVPCRTADGRIALVPMPRRALLRGGATGAALLASGVPAAAPASTAVLPEGDDPVTQLRELRRSLVRRDNLHGPVAVIDSARDHLGLVRRLRDSASGADRRALLQVQAEYAEFCGWLHQDVGDLDAARYWTDRALEWAHGSGSAEVVAYVVIRKAQLAVETGDPADAVDLAEAAYGMAQQPRSRITVMSTLARAHGHAAGGEAPASHRAYETAFDLMDTLPEQSPHRRGTWLDSPHVQAQHAHALSLLGDHEGADAGFRRALDGLPGHYRRDRGVLLAQAACARARAEDHERAAALGLQALPLAASTSSARAFAQLGALDRHLRAVPANGMTTAFRDALDAVVVHEH